MNLSFHCCCTKCKTILSFFWCFPYFHLALLDLFFILSSASALLLNLYLHMDIQYTMDIMPLHGCLRFSLSILMFFHTSCEATHRTLAMTTESGGGFGPRCGAASVFHQGGGKNGMNYSLQLIFSVALWVPQIVL